MRTSAVARFPLALAALLALATGCSRAPEPPRTTPIPGYEQLREEFGPRDFGPLAGRRVLIDPGHGGYFRGALGPDGLAEADVNLGVALHLRGLLEWAGVETHLTRSADYDFLAGTDSTLAVDLAFRVSLIDSLQPDVFLSIHHNSTASRDETINETQTYYPLNDEAASLDLARSIHRHLVRNLEIEPARILPGNFHVLRHATVPAVLGEPAMISNPVMEDRLGLAASHRLEAEAYFLGLLDYFSTGTPAWDGPDTVWTGGVPGVPDAADEADEALRWTFLPGGTAGKAGPGPDPSTFRLVGGGRQWPLHVSPDGLTASCDIPREPPAVPVRLILTGRNLAGRAAPVRETLLRPRASNRLAVRLVVPDGGAATGPTFLRWESVDGLTVAAGTLHLPGLAERTIPGGREGWTHARFEPGHPASAPRFELADGTQAPVTTRIDTLPAGTDWRHLGVGDGSPVPDGWFAAHPWRRRSDGGSGATATPLLPPVEPLIAVFADDPVWITAPGLLPFVSFAAADSGYAGTVDRSARHWWAEPLLPALLDLVVVIDPAADDHAPQGAGPTGLRGADVNLATARHTASLLTGAGAQVHLTRTEGASVPMPDRVRLAERVGADLFVTIGRKAFDAPVGAAHHPGSPAGIRWAESFAQSWNPLPDAIDTVAVAPSWAYLLRHTACPALELSLPGPDSLEAEAQLDDAGRLRAEARAIFLSIAAWAGGDEVLAGVIDPLELAAGLPAAPAPDEIDWIEWDGNFVWTPCLPCAAPVVSQPESVYSRAGRGNSPGLPAVGNRHTLEIHAGSSWQLWLLERGADRWRSRLLAQGGRTRSE